MKQKTCKTLNKARINVACKSEFQKYLGLTLWNPRFKFKNGKFEPKHLTELFIKCF